MPQKTLRFAPLHCIFAAALLAGCSEAPAPAPDLLGPVLEREQAQAVAAARIGASGGTLEVKSGDLAGLTLEIPEGALRADAVFSVYEEEAESLEKGYVLLGPAARIQATVDALLQDATLDMPFTDQTRPDLTGAVLLQKLDSTLEPVGGAALRAASMRGLIRDFGSFAVAMDEDTYSGKDTDSPVARCEFMEKGISLKGAIQTSGLVAGSAFGFEDAALLSASSYDADGCGISRGWDVNWYSVASNRVDRYATWVTGATFSGSLAFPGCTPAAATVAKDSTLLSDDFATRWGVTPQGLEIEVLNCDGGASPPKVRLKVKGSGSWADYGTDGTFLNKSF